jgi:hypothetical protein
MFGLADRQQGEKTMKKFALSATVYYNAKDEKDAEAVIKRIDGLLGDGMVKMVFKGKGINLVGHLLDPNPKEAP